MFLTGPSAEIASSMTKAIIWLLRRCFSRRTAQSPPHINPWSPSASGLPTAGLPVCREEPSAGRIINQGRGLALVKRCGWGIAERKALADAAGSMAGLLSVGLDAVGGPAGESEGVGGITSVGNARSAIRRRRLGAADGRPAAPGIEPARSAPAQEKEGKWREGLLTPFISDPLHLSPAAEEAWGV